MVFGAYDNYPKIGPRFQTSSSRQSIQKVVINLLIFFQIEETSYNTTGFLNKNESTVIFLIYRNLFWIFMGIGTWYLIELHGIKAHKY